LTEKEALSTDDEERGGFNQSLIKQSDESLAGFKVNLTILSTFNGHRFDQKTKTKLHFGLLDFDKTKVTMTLILGSKWLNRI